MPHLSWAPFVAAATESAAAPVDAENAKDDGGAESTLNHMDVCIMLKEEWSAISETNIAQCRFEADLLLVDNTALQCSRHGCYHRGIPCMSAEVAEIVNMMGACTVRAGSDFPAETADRVGEAVEWWEPDELPKAVLETTACN